MGTRVTDAYVSFEGGQNEGPLPDNLVETQTHRNINVTLKDKAIGPRPGLVEQELFIDNRSRPRSDGPTYTELLEQGRLQAFIPRKTDNGSFFIVVLSGVIYAIDLSDGCVREIVVDGNIPRLNQYRPRVNWSFAGEDIVLFDWPNNPVVIEGLEARRTNDANFEIPISYLGALVSNRLFVANNGRVFGASDPISPDFPDAPITFSESLAPSAPFLGQFFSLGSIDRSGDITAMGYFQQADTSTGFGSLFIATRETIFTAPVNQPRVGWGDGSSFTEVFLYNAGIIGARAFVNVNSDLFFMSPDCLIYSLTSRRQDQDRWGDLPISYEVSEALKTNYKELLCYTFLQYNDNRLYAAIKPYLVDALDLQGNCYSDIVFNGLVTMEFNIASGLTSQSSPIWSSIWTSYEYQESAQINQDLYFWIKKDGRNKLLKLDESINYDFIDGKRELIKTRVVTKFFDFNQPFLEKELRSLRLFFAGVKGEFYAKVYYRVDDNGPWALWADYNEDVDCDVSKAIQLRFAEPLQSVCNDNFGRFGRHYQVQLKLDIQAEDFKLSRILIEAEADDGSNIIDNCTVCNDCEVKWTYDSDFEL